MNKTDKNIQYESSRRNRELNIDILKRELDEARAEIEDMNMMILKSWD